MRYKNLNTGAETDQFSEKDWKSGQPQRAGWVETGKEPKSIPKEIIDTVFKPKVSKPKVKKNDNPKQTRRTPGKH